MVAAVRRLAREHPGGRLLVVSHGAAIRATLAHAHGIGYAEHRRLRPEPTPNCAVFRVAIENGDLSQLD